MCLLESFISMGNVKYAASVVTHEEKTFSVLVTVVDGPHVSQRTLVLISDLDISRWLVRWILKKNHYHPYKIHLHQELFPPAYEILWNIWQLLEEKFYTILYLWMIVVDIKYYSDVNTYPVSETERQNRWSVNVLGDIKCCTIFWLEIYMNYLKMYH